MNYILTTEEYEALVSAGAEAAERLRGTLQDLCTRVANSEPVQVSWIDGPPQPWGCILTVRRDHYCDECPVSKVCPHPDKMWSK